MRKFASKGGNIRWFQQTDAHFFLQMIENRCRSHPFTLHFISGRLEIVEEELLGSRLHREPLVPLQNLLRLFRAKVVGFVLVQGMHGLGIELFVIRRRAHLDGPRQLYTQESATA